MKISRANGHEEHEGYLETFLDVLLCGLGASLALLVVYSVLPKGGTALARAVAAESSALSSFAPDRSDASAAGAGGVAVAFVSVFLPSESMASPFSLTDNANQPIRVAPGTQLTRRFQNDELGTETLFRVTEFDRALVLRIRRDQAMNIYRPIFVKIFANGELKSFELELGIRDFSGFVPVIAKPEVDSRTQERTESEHDLPLLRIQPDGKVVGFASIASSVPAAKR